jgi:hypothetical protein
MEIQAVDNYLTISELQIVSSKLSGLQNLVKYFHTVPE